MIFGIDRLLKAVGILPDVPTGQQREDTRLLEVEEADRQQEEMIEEARVHLQERGTRDLTEREFMEEILQIRRRRNGGSH